MHAHPGQKSEPERPRERWVRSIKEECLSKLILFGETSLRRVVSEYLKHYHRERNHQGKGNLLLFPASTSSQPGWPGAMAVGNGWAGCSSTITGRRHNR